jgi:hypothetical protein
MKPISISEYIDQIRKELLIPRQSKTKDEALPLFFIEEVELEIGVTVSNSLSGNGKINVQLVEFGSKIDHRNETVHKIIVKMTPLLSKETLLQGLETDHRLYKGLTGVARKSVLKGDSMTEEIP